MVPAKIIARAINYPREFLQREGDLYLASVNRILDVLVAQDSCFNSIILFGRNPGMTDFANYIVPGLTDNLPTCGVVSVTFEQDDWILYVLPEIALALHDYPKKPRPYGSYCDGSEAAPLSTFSCGWL